MSLDILLPSEKAVHPILATYLIAILIIQIMETKLC